MPTYGEEDTAKDIGENYDMINNETNTYVISPKGHVKREFFFEILGQFNKDKR